MISAQTSIPKAGTDYELTAVDQENNTVHPHVELLAKIHRSADFRNLYTKLQKQLEKAAPCSFSVSWISIAGLIDNVPVEANEAPEQKKREFMKGHQAFAAVHFKTQSTAPIEVILKFPEATGAADDGEPTFDDQRIQAVTTKTVHPSAQFSRDLMHIIREFVLCLELDILDEKLIKKQRTEPVNYECCEHIFHSPVYAHYLKQMREFIAQHSAKVKLQDRHKNLMDTLNKFSSTDSKLWPSIHETFHSIWRQCLNSPTKGPEFGESLPSALVTWLYSQCDLTACWWQHLVNLTDSCMVEPTDFIAACKAFYDKLLIHPRLNGVHHTFKFDLLSAGDLPSVLWSYTHSDGTVTHFIRTSTVLYTNLSGVSSKDETTPEQLIPEFEHMLQMLEQKGLTYSYFDLRARAEEAAQRERLKNASQQHLNLKITRVDRDSDRYYQTGEFSQEQNADSVKSSVFKSAQHKHFRDDPQEANCFWSALAEKDVWEKRHRIIQEHVHKHYFYHNPNLTDEERGDLNEITLLYMAQKKIGLDKPWMASFSCFMSADRGPSFYTLLFLLHCLLSGQPITIQQIKKALAMLFAPAILTENRLMHQDRLDRFIRVAALLLSRPPLNFK